MSATEPRRVESFTRSSAPRGRHQTKPSRTVTPTRARPTRGGSSGRHADTARPSFAVRHPFVTAGLIFFGACLVTVTGSMVQSSRAMQLHNLQSQLIQEQSHYAEVVSSASTDVAPGLVASRASHLHLTHPVVILQVPTANPGATLPLPKFLVPVSIVPRTQR